MGKSCNFINAQPDKPPRPLPRSVLVTGAAGRIGRSFAQMCARRYTLKFMVRPTSENVRELEGLGEIVMADLENVSALESACAGVDAVLHLAGEANPNACWKDLHEANIIGTAHLFEAAAKSGCSKVVFASSIHAVSGYPPDVQVKTDDPVNPGDLYGVSKCFGEALGRYYALQTGMAVYVIRIGAFQSLDSARKPGSLSMMDSFIAPGDMIDLFCRCLDDGSLQFGIFHGLSDNRFKRMDISDARDLLGFEPDKDLSVENPLLRPLHLNEAVEPAKAKDSK